MDFEVIRENARAHIEVFVRAIPPVFRRGNRHIVSGVNICAPLVKNKKPGDYHLVTDGCLDLKQVVGAIAVWGENIGNLDMDVSRCSCRDGICGIERVVRLQAACCTGTGIESLARQA